MATYLNTIEAAERLGISERCVRQYCRDGRLGQRIGRNWAITEAQAKEFSKIEQPLRSSAIRPTLDVDTVYLTAAEAALRLDVSHRRIRKFCLDGRLGRRIGRNWAISEAQIKEFAAIARSSGHPGREAASKKMSQ